MRRMYGSVAVCLALAGLFLGCSDGTLSGDPAENQPPTVWLSAAPPEGSVGKYTVQLYWGGWDPDGEILRYEYLITNNTTGVFEPSDTTGATWMPVVGNDSTFVFSADSLAAPGTNNQVSEFKRSHTFFIRALDDDGLRSTEPVHRSFTARTLSPRVSIQVPRRNQQTPADVPPISTYRWEATDYVSDMLTSQEPDSVQWALVATARFNNDWNQALAYLRSPASAEEWGPWAWYRAPGDSGKSWTTPPTEFGNYLFAIRAMDEAGAITPVLDDSNVRRVRVSRRTTGPLLRVTNLYMGRVETTSCSTPLTILDLPSGIPIEFDLTATAESYGGTVVGYRYGWDISDLNDPEQWEVDLTPFVGAVATVPARSFFFGTHILTIEVLDNSGFCSRVEVKLNVVQFTMERNLLVVDDFRTDETNQAGWNNALGLGSVPSDAEHDQFWADVLADVDGFDPLRDVASPAQGQELPLVLVAGYRNIVWSVFGDPSQNVPSLLYIYIQYRSKNPTGNESASGTKVTPNLLALFMAAGGHVLVTGRYPVQNAIARRPGWNTRFPLIWLYELEGAQASNQTPDVNAPPLGDQSFGYKELCLETIDLALTNAQRRRAQAQYCPVTFVRIPNANSTRDDTMREGFPLDPRFPTLTLRPEATAPGRFYEPSRQGFEAEVYNPAYFRLGGACRYVPSTPRGCFEPIYGLVCNDTGEPTYMQPVAFFTSAFADRVADVPGAIAARSAVFGFAPVYFKPAEIKPALEVIMFDEWKLPRRASVAASD